MTEAIALCPHCGCNLEPERRATIGRLEHDPRGATFWGSGCVRLTAHEHLVLGSLVHAAGALVRASVLAERCDYDGDGNVVDVFIHRIRRKLAGAGAPIGVVETVRGRGYRLNVELLEEDARCR